MGLAWRSRHDLGPGLRLARIRRTRLQRVALARVTRFPHCFLDLPHPGANLLQETPIDGNEVGQQAHNPSDETHHDGRGSEDQRLNVTSAPIGEHEVEEAEPNQETDAEYKRSQNKEEPKRTVCHEDPEDRKN